ncbi:hypothetical protein BVY03_00135 [bacterium K02(2017)]|nr:hypothetical protein BVY03_00135 [bacterium K02(2017)]
MKRISIPFFSTPKSPQVCLPQINLLQTEEAPKIAAFESSYQKAESLEKQTHSHHSPTKITPDKNEKETFLSKFLSKNTKSYIWAHVHESLFAIGAMISTNLFSDNPYLIIGAGVLANLGGKISAVTGAYQVHKKIDKNFGLSVLQNTVGDTLTHDGLFASAAIYLNDSQVTNDYFFNQKWLLNSTLFVVSAGVSIILMGCFEFAKNSYLNHRKTNTS